MKKYWIKILKSNLMRDPSHYSHDKLYKREHRNNFFTPENLIVTIKTKVKHYHFGGPVYGAQVQFQKEGILVIKGKQQYSIKWEKVLRMELSFLPKTFEKR